MDSTAAAGSDGISYCKGLKAEKTAQLMKKSAKKENSGTKEDHTNAKKQRSSEIGDRMKQLEDAMSKNNFVKDVGGRLSKDDPNYGRPQAGTKTAERGDRANMHVHKEILDLIEIIYMNGFPVDGDADEHVSVMFFGDLFRIYTKISDKVVGILLRAKKYGLVYFEPEMLFQGMHNDTAIIMCKPMQEIYFLYNTHKTFAPIAST